MRLGLLEEIKPFRNLYHVARTDLDIATLAGIEAAEAILSADRTTFDRHFDPTEIGIRSESKWRSKCRKRRVRRSGRHRSVRRGQLW